MTATTRSKISLFSAFLLLSAGCVWVTEQVVDNAVGFPATEVASDVKRASDEYEEEKHQERVEELNEDYEEFLRSKDAVNDCEKTDEQSVVITQKRDETDRDDNCE